MIWLPLKWRVLTISFLGMTISSFVNNYGLVINDVKDAFNYTQIEANLPGALGLAGYHFTLFSAYLLERSGYAWTHLCVIIMSVLPCFLVTSATYTPGFYHNYPGLIYAYLFSLGVACAAMYNCYLKVNLANFSGDHHGKIVGFIIASAAMGPAFYAVIYHFPFYGRNKLGEFFIGMGLLLYITNLLSIILVREVDTSKEEESKILETSKSLEAGENDEERSLLEVQKETSVDESHDLNIRQIICSPTFLIIVLVISLGRGAQLTMMTMFGTIANSLQLDHLIGLVGILGPVLSTVSSLLIGFLSDRFVHIIPKVFYMIAVTVILTLLSLTSIWASKPSFIPNVIFSFMGASTYNTGITLMKDNFGLRRLTIVYGWVNLFEIFVEISFSWLCGSLYEINVRYQKNNTSNTCIGEECLESIFITLTLTYAFCCLLLAILYFRQKNARSK